MSKKGLAVVLALAAGICRLAADDTEHIPQLLLNAQRIRRLKRDRERKTVRWVNFENRVNSVTDSPERGFELALYYVITGDEQRGREAADWVLANCNQRQEALVADWCGRLFEEERAKHKGRNSCSYIGPVSALPLRDKVFLDLASGVDIAPLVERAQKDLVSTMLASWNDPRSIYAAIELIYAIRSTQRIDLREENTEFFANLPKEFLLSLKPEKLEHPYWMTHAAALALVELDPNLPSSQFLQGWALEERQMVREGPGVAYELLWADPYLPGVGYQNMDTWLYDGHGRLFARTSWDADSCWIEISVNGVERENCPPRMDTEAVNFGHLTLIPAVGRCVEIPRLPPDESIIVWKFSSRQKVYFGTEKPLHVLETDVAGMWRANPNIEGRVCVAPADKLKVSANAQ